MPRRIAVLASGNGSNLQAIIDAIAAKGLTATIAVVLSDVPGARAIGRAEAAGIPTLTLPPTIKESRLAYAGRLKAALAPYGIDLICLAGFMRIVGQPLLEAYPNRIINIHPALLPAYPGVDAIARAFADRVTETGCTVHFVDAGVDTGPVIAQTKVTVLPTDTVASLTERIHAAEHDLYPKVIQKVLDQIAAS